jgi:calcineurin-like phosphoesterase family protein
MTLQKTQIWFTADQHFGSPNIAMYCNRPFVSADDMDYFLIQKANDVVERDHWLFILGDFSMRGKITEYRDRLHCKNIVLLLGGHDQMKMSHYEAAFTKVCRYLELRVIDGDKETYLVLFHHPIERWEKWGKGFIHLHGHSHGECVSRGLRRMDVGVDAQNYKPVSFKDVVWRKGHIPIRLEPRQLHIDPRQSRRPRTGKHE